MAQNIFIFPAEDVIVEVPEKSRGHDVLVEKKKLDVTLPFQRTVINFRAYYLDKAGNKVAVTKFSPRMEIWVGYRQGEVGLDLSYWDINANAKVGMSATKVDNRHQQIYEGYGYVETTTWPDDPNIGWG